MNNELRRNSLFINRIYGFENKQNKFEQSKRLSGISPLNANLYTKGGNYSCRRSITTPERSSGVKGFAFAYSVKKRIMSSITGMRLGVSFIAKPPPLDISIFKTESESTSLISRL